MSLEVFNDLFREAPNRRTAVDAMRSLLYLEGQVRTRLEAQAAGTGDAARTSQRVLDRVTLFDPPAPPTLVGLRVPRVRGRRSRPPALSACSFASSGSATPASTAPRKSSCSARETSTSFSTRIRLARAPAFRGARPLGVRDRPAHRRSGAGAQPCDRPQMRALRQPGRTAGGARSGDPRAGWQHRLLRGQQSRRRRPVQDRFRAFHGTSLPRPGDRASPRSTTSPSACRRISSTHGSCSAAPCLACARRQPRIVRPVRAHPKLRARQRRPQRALRRSTCRRASGPARRARSSALGGGSVHHIALGADDIFATVRRCAQTASLRADLAQLLRRLAGAPRLDPASGRRACASTA